MDRTDKHTFAFLKLLTEQKLDEKIFYDFKAKSVQNVYIDDVIYLICDTRGAHPQDEMSGLDK